MNAGELLRNYERVADAPDAVSRLRRFVLELAVRGKLIPQSAGDQQSADLVALARDASSQGNSLPRGWVYATVGQLLDFKYGKGLASSDRSTSGPTPVFGSNGVVGFTTTPLTANPSIIVGRKGSAGALNICDGPSWTTDVAYYIEPPPFFELRYLYLALSALGLDALGKGVKPGLSRSDAYELEIWVPPFAEQHRIVAKVDELMALCDRLEAARAEREAVRDRLAAASLVRLNAPDPETFSADARFALDALPALTARPDQINQLRQTILGIAMSGRLVAQDEAEEPASAMLARGGRLPNGYQRRRKILKESSVAPPSELFPPIPKTWVYSEIQALYELNVVIDYADGNHGALYPRSSEFGDDGVTFVTAKDLTDGRVTWASCAKLNEARAKQLPKGWSRGGDVLLTHNATVGRVAKVEPNIGPFLLGTSVTFYRLNEAILNSDFFYYMLQSSIWQGQLEAIMAQTTRNQVSIQKQASFRVVVPPIAEQRRIVKLLDGLMALCVQLESSLSAEAEHRAHLLAALLHQALEPAESLEEAA